MPPLEQNRVVAMLGPTNTGKTHRAVERMLEFPTGMIGLPLRLLAREVYDRITALKGEDAVALVTGEERRIGANARYWVCTVEAMPVDRPVAFLAIDEIQLAGDRSRGHVFTDRILNARGVRETWFLGSETVEPLLSRMIPTLEVRRNNRFSRLSYKGPHKLGSLPGRTALVAFSVERVYALAEELRRRHGGTAVVLGALSPRTRNAQVAMYQAGEVQYMVATDAIGMGLNMDVDHVAFDALQKFDGQQRRGLYPQEVGQIAGRAGRWRKDGTFGGTMEVGELPPKLVEAVESHGYPPLKKLFYRSSDLDFSSPEELLASLRRPAPFPFLIDAREEEDEVALRTLLRDPELRRSLRDPEEVALLWEVCRIPDFRKTLTDAHIQLLTQVFELVRKGPMPADFLARQIDRLDRPEGDVDALTTRLAWIRTWTYITHRAAWLPDPEHWQARARTVEDHLSDALHTVLTERFVDPTSRMLARKGAIHGGAVVLGGREAGRLEGLTWRPSSNLPADRRVEKAVAQALEGELKVRVARLVEAPHADLEREGLALSWEGGPLARMIGGPTVLEPGIKLLRNDLLGPADLARIQRRVMAWLRDEMARFLAPIAPNHPGLGPSVRALLYRLQLGLGSVARSEVRSAIAELSPVDWSQLRLLRIHVGEVYVFSRGMLDAKATSFRAAVAAVSLNLPEVPSPENATTTFLERTGLVRLESEIFRVDQVERIAERLRAQSRRGEIAASELGGDAGGRERAIVLARALGWSVEGECLLPPRHPGRRPPKK